MRKAASNLAKHGVSFEDASTAFGDPLGRITHDPRHSADEERWVLLGMARRGRLLAVMFTTGATRFESSAQGKRRGGSARNMKRRQTKGEAAEVAADEILPQYDFSRAQPNKYAERYAAGSTVVVLEPDVAAMFPDAAEVNEALRALGGIIRKHRSSRPGR